MTRPPPPPALRLERIQRIDALRGFALLLIALVHFMEQYLGNLPPPEHSSYTRHSSFDGVLEGIFFALVRGKGFALFSFMFGLSFYLQMERAARRLPNADFRPRYAWRLIVLLAIGYLHSLLYAGDILMIYAVLGLPLILFYRVRDRWLWLLAALLIVGTPRLCLRLAHKPPSTTEAQARKAELENQARAWWHGLRDGSLREIAWQNGTQGMVQRAGFQFGPIARGYQTFALLLIGLWAGRLRLLEDPEAHPEIFRRLFRWCGWLTVAIPLAGGALFLAQRAAVGEASQAPEGSPDLLSWPRIVGLGVYDVWNFVMTLFYVLLFVRLSRRAWWWRGLKAFVPVGQMALSSYVAQSVVGLLVFSGAGLGWLGQVGNTITLGIGLGVFGLQMAGCGWWLARFRFGPLEWLWRSFTCFALATLAAPVEPRGRLTLLHAACCMLHSAFILA